MTDKALLNPATLRLVLIEWLDSAGCTSRWNELEPSSQQTMPLKCKSVGWLTHADEHVHVIAPHVTPNPIGEPCQSMGEMTIPTVCVVRLVDLLERTPEPPLKLRDHLSALMTPDPTNLPPLAPL